MDFNKQSKLSKEEWANIEVPCSENEKRILALISDGYADVNISRNYTLSLVQYMKLGNPAQFDEHIYKNYFIALVGFGALFRCYLVCKLSHRMSLYL